MAKPFVAIAGATGVLGQLIAKELRQRGVSVTALVRPKTDPTRIENLRNAGVTIVPVDLSSVQDITRELIGATCVVSTLQGLREVLHTAQGNLLDAAVAAGVPRFIPSDYSLDFTKTKPGSNRNLDLHRQFHTQLDRSGISWTSILNGGFMDLLGGDSPMVNHRRQKVPYAGKATQLLDFTTMADTAAYTAAVAVDPKPTPKFLRIAGDSVSAKDIAEAESQVHGTEYRPLWIGNLWFLKFMIRILQFFGGQDKILPAWQGMQYMENMFSGAGKLDPLDNDRYPELEWTKVVDYLREEKASKNLTNL